MMVSSWQPEPRTLRAATEWRVQRWREYDAAGVRQTGPTVIEIAIRNATGRTLLLHMTPTEAESLACALVDETREVTP